MTEFFITEKVWEIVSQYTGIPFCEIDKDTDIVENRSSIIQDVGIILRIPVYGMKISVLPENWQMRLLFR